MSNSLTAVEIGDLEKLEKVVESGKKTFVQVGLALTEIRDRELFKNDFQTFGAYCEKRWGWGHKRASQLIVAAAVVSALPQNVSTSVDNEAAARQLSKAPAAQRAPIVASIIESGEKVTAPAIAKRTAPTPPVPPTPAKKPEPVVVRDNDDWPIPDKLLLLWNRAQEVQDDMTIVSNLRAKYKRLQEEKDPLYVHVTPNQLFAELSQLHTSIKGNLPHAVCTSCNGFNSDACTFCKGFGLIPKFKYEYQASQAIITIRHKQCKPKP